MATLSQPQQAVTRGHKSLSRFLNLPCQRVWCVSGTPFPHLSESADGLCNVLRIKASFKELPESWQEVTTLTKPAKEAGQWPNQRAQPNASQRKHTASAAIDTHHRQEPTCRLAEHQQLQRNAFVRALSCIHLRKHPKPGSTEQN